MKLVVSSLLQTVSSVDRALSTAAETPVVVPVAGAENLQALRLEALFLPTLTGRVPVEPTTLPTITSPFTSPRLRRFT